MGYDWDDKREICYRLYVVEKKSLEEVVAHFKDTLDFVPSKRTFQTQFRRWGFPTKLDYSHKDAAVVQRVRDMWEKNVMQKDMLPILHDEGFNVTESGLTRLRAKHNMHLKSANGVRAGIEGAEHEVERSMVEESHPLDILAGLDTQYTAAPITPISQPRERVRKRKRHTEGTDGLAEAISSTPRYPSETTIGDAQKFLGLNDEMYREVREHFRTICEQRDIMKKTICGPERWEAAKGQLVQDYPYLQQQFMTSDASSHQPLTLSLDIICMDVTKNMRVKSKTMSLSEAKNLLGLNPLWARVLKTKLINILRANNFVNTYESDNWNGLKEQWLEDTHLKAKIPEEEGPERERVLKAVQLVCRDTLKRWREAQRGAKLKGGDEGDDGVAQPGAELSPLPTDDLLHSHERVMTPTQPAQKAPKARRGRKPATSAAVAAATSLAAQEARIDPSLLQAATGSGTHMESEVQGSYPLPSTADDLVPEPPLPVYFRRGTVAGDSVDASDVPPLWLGALGSRSLSSLHQAALSFPGGQRYRVVRMEGVAGSGNSGHGGELLYQIDQDDELQGYLLHNESSKASFVVHLGARA